VIRNAGGRSTDDAVRSLLISSWLLGTREFLVIHHTDCGMAKFTDDAVAEIIAERSGEEVSDLDFLHVPRPGSERPGRRRPDPLAQPDPGGRDDLWPRVRRQDRDAAGGGSGRVADREGRPLLTQPWGPRRANAARALREMFLPVRIWEGTPA
jgi:hypothetical protein